VLVLAAGAAAAWLHRQPAVLAAPVPCPGLLEFAALAGARAAPDIAVGSWLVAANSAAIFLAAAAFGWLVREAAGSWRVAVVSALALGLLAPFAPALATTDALAVAVVSVTWLYLLRLAAAPDQLRGRQAKGVLAGLLLAALLSPPLAIVFAVVAAGVVSASPARGRALVAVPFLTVGLAAALVALYPDLPPSVDGERGFCLVAGLQGYSFRRVLSSVQDVVVAPAGAYAIALATLGAYTLRSLLRCRDAWLLAIYVSLPLFAAGWAPDPTVRILAPVLTGFWLLVAFGLLALVGAARQSLGGRLAGAALLALVPLLQIARPDRLPRVESTPLGHETLSLRAMERILAVMPDESVLVEEDAIVDLLLRALDGTWQKSGKTLRLAGRWSEALVGLSSSPAVRLHALPSAQAELQNLGFHLSETGPPQLSGVVEVRAGGSCQALTPGWTDATRSAGFGSIAIVARSGDSRGPVQLWFGGTRRFDPQPVHPPPHARFGYFVTMYASASAEDRAKRERDVVEAGLDTRQPVLAAPHVLNLEMWRRPGAPLMLTMSLGATPEYAIARHAPGPAQQLLLCPAFPFERRPIGTP
jgi:hypothetical protein